MPPSPRLAQYRIGDIVEVGFVFRHKTANALLTPGTVTVKVYNRDGLVETIDETDPRVTLGATLGTDLADDLDLTAAENSAGTGIVAVEITPTIRGPWSVYCKGNTLALGAQTRRFHVVEPDD